MPAPSSDRSQPASRSATDNPSQVIEVGSATAITPGISASRLLSADVEAANCPEAVCDNPEEFIHGTPR
jgi:hypothetical protein